MTDFLNQSNNSLEPQFQAQIEPEQPQPLKKWYKKAKFLIPAVVVLVVAIGVSANLLRDKKVEKVEAVNEIKEVKTLVLDENKQNADEISLSGVVKADTKVDVVALGSGTLRNIYFKIGDIVPVNSLLANIYDPAVLANLSNAQVSLNNANQSYDSLRRLTEESVKQAEQSVKNAEAGLESAQDNYANVKEIQKTSKNDSFSNAVITYQGHLNTVKSTLDQIDYIIDADDGEGSQLPGISATLSVKNVFALQDAENIYLKTKSNLKVLEKQNVSANNIIEGLIKLTNLLNQTKKSVDKAIIVLDNTITSPSFSEASLLAQKSALTSQRSVVVGAQNSSQASLQTLQNIDIINKRELDALKNAVTAAQNQLLQAQTALQNAKASQNQQLVSSRSAIDASRGQVNVIGTQVADLSIKAPISGTITKKYVEVGAEVNPGQKIAEISQTDLIKIEIDLTSEDIYRIELGQEVIINGNLIGSIAKINPSADPLTKKVKVEIGFDNSNKDLVAETFVDVVIPVNGIGRSEFIAGRFFVPLKAVTITQTEKYVFLAKDGKSAKTPVEIGKTESDKVEIISGLANGDELIIEGNRNLEGNEEITIKN